MSLYQILTSTKHRKISRNMKNNSHKNHKNNKFNQRQYGMINLNYPMDHVLYQIFRISLSISSKSMIH